MLQAGDVQEILALEKARFAIPVLKAWFIEEWEPWYGLGGQGDAEVDLRACCNHDRLPIALVAIGKDGQILGTAALKTKSLGSEYGYGPWLAALLVDKPCRGRGIGTLLIGAIEEQARRLGFSAIYASTDSAGSILTRRGWSQTGDQSSPCVGRYRFISARSSEARCGNFAFSQGDRSFKALAHQRAG